MNIYVATSWRNERQPEVIRYLRAVGHEVYDFRNPGHGESGFNWHEIDETWKDWTLPQYLEGLKHHIAVNGFNRDMVALRAADLCVLVLPCGRSAHLEAGFAAGNGARLFILMSPGGMLEPELMYSMAGWIGDDLADLIEAIRQLERKGRLHAAPIR